MVTNILQNIFIQGWAKKKKSIYLHYIIQNI